MILAFAVLVALSAGASAQYAPPAASDTGNGGGNNPAVFNPVYIGVYRDNSREHERRRECARIRTYLPTYPSFTSEAFYPPIIRYVRSGRKVSALIICDANPKTLNILVSRINSSDEFSSANTLAYGTTAGAIVNCDRHEERYFGNALRTENPPTFTENVRITQVACLRGDRTPLGQTIQSSVDQLVAISHAVINSFEQTRKKRDVSEDTTGITETSTDASSDASSTTPGTTVELTTGSEDATTATVQSTGASETTTEVTTTAKDASTTVAPTTEAPTTVALTTASATVTSSIVSAESTTTQASTAASSSAAETATTPSGTPTQSPTSQVTAETSTLPTNQNNIENILSNIINGQNSTATNQAVRQQPSLLGAAVLAEFRNLLADLL